MACHYTEELSPLIVGGEYYVPPYANSYYTLLSHNATTGQCRVSYGAPHKARYPRWMPGGPLCAMVYRPGFKS